MSVRNTSTEFAPRSAAKVKTVAALLDADPAIVRRLVNKGELESFTIGKRGVRIYLDSVADYQQRQARQTPPRAAERQQRRQVSRAAAREAIEGLRKLGVKI